MRFTWRVFFVVAIVVASAVPRASMADTSAPPDLTPVQIFAKHAAAIGFSLSAGTEKPYLMKTTTKWKDKNGEHSETLVEKRAGAFSHFAESRDGITRTWGFDSTGFWVADNNGNVATEISYERPFDVTWSIIESEAFDATLRAELRPPVGSDYVVRISPSSGVPADLFFNQTQLTIDKVVVDPGRDDIEESYSDYHRYGPALIANTRKIYDATTTVTDFEWNAPLTTDDFNRPSQRTYAVFPTSGSDSESFSTKYYSGVILNATINGVQGRFLLDTGSSDVVVDPSFATRAKLDTHGSGGSEMVFGYVGLKFSQVSSLDIGSVKFQNITVDVPDHAIGSSDFDGVIGYSALNQTVFTVDFDANKVTFYNPATFKPPASPGYIVIGMDSGTPQVQVTIDTKIPVFMDLDLGASGVSMIFTKSFLQANPGIVEGGFRGNGAMIGTLAQIGLGPFQFFGLSAGVLTTDAGFGGERVLQGLVGYEVLRRFNLTFDYQSNRVYLVLNKYGNDTTFKRE